MNKLYNNILKSLLLASIITMVPACSSDDSYDVTGEKENRVFCNMQYSGAPNGVATLTNSTSYSILLTPISVNLENAEKIEVKIPVNSTKVAQSDIKANIAIDNTNIPEGYSALPANVTPVLSASSATIKAGSQSSTDNVIVTISNDDLPKLSLDEAPYVLPVKITSTDNATLSSNLNTAYIVINIDYSNIDNSNASSATGTAIEDRSSWKVDVDGVATTALSDGNSLTFSDNESLPTVTIDLGSVQKITGASATFYQWYYGANGATIFTSTDGVNYANQGNHSFNQYSANCYYNFYGAIEARYVRIQYTSFFYYDEIAIREVYVYTQE